MSITSPVITPDCLAVRRAIHHTGFQLAVMPDQTLTARWLIYLLECLDEVPQSESYSFSQTLQTLHAAITGRLATGSWAEDPEPQ